MLDIPINYFWLFPLGLLIGAFGTRIGAGGSFILVPILLLIYPNENTELITSDGDLIAPASYCVESFDSFGPVDLLFRPLQ